MIDLCIDARMAFSSGIGTCIREIVPHFCHPPFRTSLLVDRLEQPWCREFQQKLFPIPIYSLSEQASFRKYIPSCDLFWSPHYNVPLLPIKAKKRITTIHDACHLALGRFWEKGYAHLVMRRALFSSDAVITVSAFSEQELYRYLGRPKRDVHVIPIGVNTDRFRPIEETAILQSVRKKYQLPERFILFVGNLKPHKNLAGLLQAFGQKAFAEWSLVLVGKEKGFAGQGERVIVTGEVPDEDLPPLYSLADLFVFPSFYEGFGLPPLEAMSCGCPTVVSQAASIPEVCGEASLYFRPDQPDEMAAAIKKALFDHSLRKNLVAKGFERVQQFTWSQTAEKYRSLFEQVHYA